MIGPHHPPVNPGASGKDITTHPHSDVDREIIYTGEVELAIPAPVDLKMVSALYNCLQTIPELRILLTRGTFSRGAVITVVLEKPTLLIEILSSKLANVDIIPETLNPDMLQKENPASLNIARSGGEKRIVLVSKSA